MTEKRFEYWEDSDTAYDTKRKYGQYFCIIDKRDMVYLLNEQDVRIKELESENKMLKTTKRWSFNGGVIVGTDICEEGIPHTNRSIVTHLNMYERKIRELEEENEQLKKENKGLQFKIIDMLNFVKEKGTVTREEIKEWWNKGMKDGDVE